MLKLYRKVEQERRWLKLKLQNNTITDSTIDTCFNAIVDEIMRADSQQVRIAPAIVIREDVGKGQESKTNDDKYYMQNESYREIRRNRKSEFSD